jgi:hypothetical protein
MKKILLVLAVVAFGMTSCSVNSSDNVNIDGEDMVYFKDSRTGLCFGAVASRKAMTASTTGLGVTCVPCKEVEHLIK